MKKIVSFFAGMLALWFCFAEKTPVENLYEYTLPNGLSLFVAENHSVPLAYVEVAVKCGAYTQDRNTAGLFHLYEHMMFKGNRLYRNAAEVTDALSDLGVANWNGTTDIECVNYYFTVPSGAVRKGLEFWNAAIRFPLLDRMELENEKKVVLSEIAGNFSNPSRIALNFVAKEMFPLAPWKLDASGSADVVKSATVKKLKQIQKAFYIPNNSAVFVGGDVNPSEIYEMVLEIFGDWKKGGNPFEKSVFSHAKEPFSSARYAVMPFDRCSSEIAAIEVLFRGPDLAFDIDRADSYAMDVLSEIIARPDGEFKKNVAADGYIGSPTEDYVSGGYVSRRSCGQVSFSATVTLPEEELPLRAVYFSERVSEFLNSAVLNMEVEDVKKTVFRIEDSMIFANETPQGILGNARFWWCVADSKYFYTYGENMLSVKPEDIRSVVEKYMIAKNPLVMVLVNPEVYEKSREDFISAGFTEISGDNAFWFK